MWQDHDGAHQAKTKPIIIYMKIFGMAEDENGNPAFAGVKLNIGETEKDIDYNELISGIDKDGLLKFMGIDGIVTADDITFITPEEYDRDYGEDT